MADEPSPSPVREHALVSVVRHVVARHEITRLPLGAGAQAGVLIPVMPMTDGPCVVLTVRSDRVEHHKGEISFPGGGRDPEDVDLLATALREADEEVGIAADHVEVLGERSHYRTISNFHVVPYVGLLDRAPYPFRPLEVEVAEILTVPLSHLINPSCQTFNEYEREGRVVRMREFWWGEHRIWGATAAMLGSLVDEVRAHLSARRA